MGRGQPSTKLLKGKEEDDYKKKMIHRDIERQRRKEMATLYAGLRSVIPLEYIKGKRATSDHMNGAVDYIKRLQMRITDLGAQRDDLIKKSNLRVPDSMSTSNGSSDNSSTLTSIVVHPCSAGGVEIVLSSCSSNNSTASTSFPLSRVLQVLLEQGLDIVSCAITKVNERAVLHTIQAEVADDPTGINCDQLQEEIKEIISSWNKDLHSL
ncbi:Achaete-scute transcription factor-related [Parasponia andersonii]|uniref:Achaete-scute transcription factor-related n=1 Tax=Parasponia andersonii TaxID=3476 RepID=A0A2P5D9K3_PARAD|nr:Achaete-scute transcription factor-related [Parasponia andersonii]